MTIFRLTDTIEFPPPHLANPGGLLAVGGDLSPQRLICAYQNGIFPWFSEDEPILWWSPDPRMVLYPRELIISKSLRKTCKSGKFKITLDTDFDQKIAHCASTPRCYGPGTWITNEMAQAYSQLHRLGLAHSVEAWHDNELVGGLYGVSLGRCFFGESMFSTMRDASKVALVALVDYLARHQFELIDCQVPSDHLQRLGARTVSRDLFLSELRQALIPPSPVIRWSLS